MSPYSQPCLDHRHDSLLPSPRWPSLLLRLTSNVCMHLHKKGVLAQASAQEQSVNRVPRCLHGLYDEAGPKLQAKHRRKHQSDSQRKWYRTFTKCWPRARHRPQSSANTISESWDSGPAGCLRSRGSLSHRVWTPTWACLTENPLHYYTICF